MLKLKVLDRSIYGTVFMAYEETFQGPEKFQNSDV